jgi:hypothetical protein
MPAAMQSLVQSVVQKVDSSQPDSGLVMRQARRVLGVLRTASSTRLGAPILSTSQRALALCDRVLDAGMQTRVYKSTEQITTRAVVLSSTGLKTASSTLTDTRMKTRVRYERMRSSVARLPSELKTNLQVYYKAKSAHMAQLSAESRANLKRQMELCSKMLNDIASNSKVLTFLSSKAKALLVLARLLPKEDAANALRVLPTVPHNKDARLAAPKTFTSFVTSSNVTPKMMTAAISGDISPSMLGSLRRGIGSPSSALPAATSVANPSSAVATDFSNPSVKENEDSMMHVQPVFNAEGRGGLWVPSPIKV